jgi:uncharacterized protein (DUF1697 family)
MTTYIALLRAVNVGGTGKLPMRDLKHICESVGFDGVETYIASGNVVFESERSEAEIKALLEAELRSYVGKLVGVLERTAGQMAKVIANNPFPTANPSRTVAVFLDEPPAADALSNVVGQDGEELRLGTREVYVQYGDTMGRSKLRIPAAKDGTARNMNTVAKLADMASSRVADD